MGSLDLRFQNQEDAIEIDHDPHFNVQITGRNTAKSIRSFEDSSLGLDQKILENIKSVGFTNPTAVQCHGMPQLMAKLDIMCCACTGSGKSAAYLLPVINLLTKESGSEQSHEIASPKALILVPTHELAEQICKDAQLYTKNLPLSVLAVYGGDSIPRELRILKQKKVDILVATPGRLHHLLSEFNQLLTLEKTKFLIIDEADEMFNRSFFPQIHNIEHGYMQPKESRITAMFSATFPKQIQYYAKKHLRTDFVFVIIGILGGASPHVIQEFIPTSEVEKQMKLIELLENGADKKILIFRNNIFLVDTLVSFLRLKGYKPAYIHGRLSQYERDQALSDFNEGSARILVASSVLSRGLNICDVSLVINCDIPENLEDYVQRIGRVRTSATGELGVAISFYDEEKDHDLFPELMFALKSANQTVPPFMADGNENQNEPAPEEFDAVMDEDIINKMKKFKIPKTYETFEDDDYFG